MSQNGAPQRGVPLRWQLGLSTSVIVTLVLSSSTFHFQKDAVAQATIASLVLSLHIA